jgi:hypothetical protein
MKNINLKIQKDLFGLFYLADYSGKNAKFLLDGNRIRNRDKTRIKGKIIKLKLFSEESKARATMDYLNNNNLRTI